MVEGSQIGVSNSESPDFDTLRAPHAVVSALLSHDQQWSRSMASRIAALPDSHRLSDDEMNIVMDALAGNKQLFDYAIREDVVTRKRVVGLLDDAYFLRDNPDTTTISGLSTHRVVGDNLMQYFAPNYFNVLAALPDTPSPEVAFDRLNMLRSIASKQVHIIEGDCRTFYTAHQSDDPLLAMSDMIVAHPDVQDVRTHFEGEAILHYISRGRFTGIIPNVNLISQTIEQFRRTGQFPESFSLIDGHESGDLSRAVIVGEADGDDAMPRQGDRFPIPERVIKTTAFDVADYGLVVGDKLHESWPSTCKSNVCFASYTDLGHVDALVHTIREFTPESKDDVQEELQKEFAVRRQSIRNVFDIMLRYGTPGIPAGRSVRHHHSYRLGPTIGKAIFDRSTDSFSLIAKVARHNAAQRKASRNRFDERETDYQDGELNPILKWMTVDEVPRQVIAELERQGWNTVSALEGGSFYEKETSKSTLTAEVGKRCLEDLFGSSNLRCCAYLPYGIKSMDSLYTIVNPATPEIRIGAADSDGHIGTIKFESLGTLHDDEGDKRCAFVKVGTQSAQAQDFGSSNQIDAFYLETIVAYAQKSGAEKVAISLIHEDSTPYFARHFVKYLQEQHELEAEEVDFTGADADSSVIQHVFGPLDAHGNERHPASMAYCNPSDYDDCYKPVTGPAKALVIDVAAFAEKFGVARSCAEDESLLTRYDAALGMQ